MLYLSNIKCQDGEGSSALHVVTEQLQEAAEEEAQNLVRMSSEVIIIFSCVLIEHTTKDNDHHHNVGYGGGCNRGFDQLIMVVIMVDKKIIVQPQVECLALLLQMPGIEVIFKMKIEYPPERSSSSSSSSPSSSSSLR